jgi:polar amino acid transport system substrate-binding protein
MRPWSFIVAVALASCASVPEVSTEARNQLAPSGKVRAAINYGNPALAERNAATGALRGVSVELATQLGRRLGVPVDLVGYETVGKLLAGLKAGEWDVAFLAIDPTRREVAFTPPYMEVEVTYLVAERAPMRQASMVDSPGVRIVVQGRNAADLFLTRELKHASLERKASTTAAFEALKSGSADAFADNRQHLASVIAANPGYRILDGRFTSIPHAMAVPASRPAAAGYLRRFVEDAKSSGFVQGALDRSGVRGIRVAPRP